MTKVPRWCCTKKKADQFVARGYDITDVDIFDEKNSTALQKCVHNVDFRRNYYQETIS